MVTYKIKRLWLPKRINGKWHWLSKIKIEEEEKIMFIEGNYTPYVTRKYTLLKGDGSLGK